MAEENKQIVECSVDFEGQVHVIPYLLEYDEDGKPFVNILFNHKVMEGFGKFPLTLEFLKKLEGLEVHFRYEEVIHVSRTR